MFREFHILDHKAIRRLLGSIDDFVEREEFPSAIDYINKLDEVFINHVDYYDRSFYNWVNKQ